MSYIIESVNVIMSNPGLLAVDLTLAIAGLFALYLIDQMEA